MLNTISPAISVITQIELLSFSKITIQENLYLKDFIQNCIIFDKIDSKIIEHTINIRQEYKTQLPDAIIAATSIATNRILITSNSKDFLKIPKLKIINPKEL